MNRIKTYFNGTMKFAFPILYLYIFTVQIIMIGLYYNVSIFALISTSVISLILTPLVIYAFQKLSDIHIQMLPLQSRRRNALIFLCVFIGTIAFYMLYFAAKFPDDILGEGGDCLNQYQQATGVKAYDNWHPVLHTFLFYTLPLKLFDSMSFVVFLQVLYFCLAFSYLIFVLYQCGAPRLFLICLCLYVWLNPYLAGWMMYPVKDSALAIFSITLTAYYIRIFFSKGAWLSKPRNIILFALIMVGCTYMRHNALLFTIPLTLIVLFYSVREKKTRGLIIIAIIAVIALVRLLYSFLDVQSPSFRTEEKIGLAVSVWCYVMQVKPEALPEETREIMYDLIPAEAYEDYDVNEGFNSIKFQVQDSWYNIDELSYAEVFKYTYQCFRYAPAESMRALSEMIGLVLSLDEQIWPKIKDEGLNHLGLENSLFSGLSVYAQQLVTLFSNSPFQTLFGSLGFFNLAIVIVAVVLFSHNRAAILHSLPLLCYNLGTMLFLAGSEYRYFILNYPLWMVVIFIMLADENKCPCLQHCTEEFSKNLRVFSRRT